ncbi:MAG: DUF5675 family protein [Bacteroidota bacterium]
MAPVLTITREAIQPDADRTLGTAALATQAGIVWQGYSLEPPWVDRDGDGVRDRGVSCIPPGTYRAVPHGWGRDARWTRFDQVWRLEGVPGGTAILVHALNFPWQTRGCVGLGEGLGDLDGDGRPDLVSSQAAIRAVRAAVRRRWLWVVVTQAPEPLSEVLVRLAGRRVDGYPLVPLKG